MATEPQKTQTTGTDTRPARDLRAPAMLFDLDAEITQLQKERTAKHEVRSAKVLTRDDTLRMTLVSMQAGSKMADHAAPGEIAIQVLRGALRVSGGAQSFDLALGRMLTLEKGITHDVEALEESVFMLTIAR